MKFVETNEKIVRTRAHNLKVFFEEFISSNIKFAKVELKEGEYKTPGVAISCFRNSCNRYGFPIRFFLRKEEIFMERKDI